MMENGFKRHDVLNCTNCGHHLYDHSFADPRVLTKSERISGGIPWLCFKEGCECSEFLPRK